MPSSSHIAHDLANTFDRALSRGEVSEKEAVKVSTAISTVAFFYEKIRNVIDYKEDHLFCQAAIERGLLRQNFPHRLKNKLPESLVKDLIRAGYLAKDGVSQDRIKEVQTILGKYAKIGQNLRPNVKNDQKLRSWLLNLASAEIEKSLSPDPEGEAIASAFYRLLLPNIIAEDLPPQEKNILAYLAARKTLLKSSAATLRYSLLLGFHPEWAAPSESETSLLARDLPEIKEKIESYLRSPFLGRLILYFRRFTAPFLVLQDVLGQSAPQSADLLNDQEALEKSVREACRQRYQKIRSTLTRAATRSIIYIFLTKMVLALVLEVPFDLYVAREVHLLPIAINTLFPPFLMFALVLSIPKPGSKNTQRILKDILEIIYRGTFKTPPFSLNAEEEKRQSLKSRVFRFLYLLTFLLTFGLIICLLRALGFNFLSVLIFLFFITVVSFFAYRVSQSAREIVIEEKETTFSAILDFFMLPILRTGQQLSSQLSKINVFNFLLDFVIEAPLKNILEIAEDWLGFMREKKEEVA